MAELVTITDGNKVITVTKKAFDVIYKRHGFKVYKEETKTKRTRKKKTTTETTEEAK